MKLKKRVKHLEKMIAWDRKMFKKFMKIHKRDYDYLMLKIDLDDILDRVTKDIHRS